MGIITHLVRDTDVMTAENIIPSHWKIIASSMDNISTPDDPLLIKGLNQILVQM